MFEKLLADFDLGAFLHQFYMTKRILCSLTMDFSFISSFYLLFCFIFLENILSPEDICFVSSRFYFFYKASGAFVLLVILSAIVDFVLSNAIYKTPDKKKKDHITYL